MQFFMIRNDPFMVRFFQRLNSAAYQDGLQAGQSDYHRNLNRNLRSRRWTSGQQLRDYQSGYGNGYYSRPITDSDAFDSEK